MYIREWAISRRQSIHMSMDNETTEGKKTRQQHTNRTAFSVRWFFLLIFFLSVVSISGSSWIREKIFPYSCNKVHLVQFNLINAPINLTTNFVDAQFLNMHCAVIYDDSVIQTWMKNIFMNELLINDLNNNENHRRKTHRQTEKWVSTIFSFFFTKYNPWILNRCNMQ